MIITWSENSKPSFLQNKFVAVKNKANFFKTNFPQLILELSEENT